MTSPAGRAVRMSYLVASVAGVAFFVMSVALLAVWPGRVLERQSRLLGPEAPLGLTESERRGRAVYAREGCAYCHTQQIRYLEADIARFGAPTLAWETQLDYPHLWGTRRIGPDLARAGGTRSTDWHLAHLYAPRSLVPGSVMPGYRWLFDGSPDRPLPEARDLVAYLESLGRARELAGPEGEARARAACNCPDDAMMQMALNAPALNANPARPQRGVTAPVLSETADRTRGDALYAAHCASCHGPRGEGDGPGALTLRPRPANLAEHEYTLTRLSDSLWNGIAGTSMPSWRDHPLEDLAAMAAAVRALQRPQPDVGSDVLPGLGRGVYDANCIQCHGSDGGGDGSAAGELSIAPTSFRAQRPSLAQSLRALRNGIEGTRMGAWGDRLTEAELVAVAAYVRTFYRPEPAQGAEAPR